MARAERQTEMHITVTPITIVVAEEVVHPRGTCCSVPLFPPLHLPAIHLPSVRRVGHRELILLVRASSASERERRERERGHKICVELSCKIPEGEREFLPSGIITVTTTAPVPE